MRDFNIAFEFVANLGETTLARTERRWNGQLVLISRSLWNKLDAVERYNLLMHEFNHAICEHLLADGVELPLDKASYE